MEDLARKRRIDENRRTIAGGSRIRWEVAAADDDHLRPGANNPRLRRNRNFVMRRRSRFIFLSADFRQTPKMKRQRKRGWRVNGGIFLML